MYLCGKSSSMKRQEVKYWSWLRFDLDTAFNSKLISFSLSFSPLKNTLVFSVGAVVCLMPFFFLVGTYLV